MVGLDAAAKTVTLASGRTIQYDSLLTTMPLDITLRQAGNLLFNSMLIWTS